MTAHAGTDERRKRAPIQIDKVCGECGAEYVARSPKSLVCDTCRPIVHRRRVRLNGRRKRGSTGRKDGLTCRRCREKKPHSAFDRTKQGNWRHWCRKCFATPREERRGRLKTGIPTSWLLPRPLTKREALMIRVGGPSPCFHCYHASKCQERNAALDDRPLPCFEGDE